MWPLLFHTSNPVSEMDESHTRARSPTFARLLLSYCSCCGSDDERSLLRLLWFQKVKRSTPRVDSVSGESQNWRCKGWNSVRRAGESSKSVIHDAGSCCSWPKWKHFFPRLKKDSKTIRSSKHSRFNYDPLSYELNFDDASRQYEDYQLRGLSLSAVKHSASAGALLVRSPKSPGKSLN